MTPLRIAIITSERRGTASYCIPALASSNKVCIVGVIVAENKTTKSFRLFKRKLLKIMRIGVLGALNGIRIRNWFRSNAPNIEDLCQSHSIPISITSGINSDVVENTLRYLNPDLGLSLGNSYISERIFSVPKYGMINVHGERLPEYKNAQSVIWPIYNQEKRSGISVHKISRLIDGGDILHVAEFPIVFKDRLENTVRETLAQSRRHLPNIVLYVCENFLDLSDRAKKQEAGNSYTTPSMTQFLRMMRNNKFLYSSNFEIES